MGSYAVQIAKALGAEVTGVASTRKLDLVIDIALRHLEAGNARGKVTIGI